MPQPRMNPEIKALWVKRLRELPNHRQGKKALRTNNKMCCLGVLCELAVAEGVVTRNKKNTNNTFSYGGGRTETLPYEVIRWAGLTEQGVVLSANDPKIRGVNLSYWNDHEDKNFDEIADLIEEYL